MKKRIGTIYNKPIIEGDINLKTPNEIHKNELKGGGDNSSGSSVSKYAPRYFKIDWNVASKDWEAVLSLGNVDSTVSLTNIVMNIGATFKRSIHLDNGKAYYITAYPFFNLDKDDDYSFSYNPLYIEQSLLDALNIEAKGGIMNFEDIIKICSNYFSIVFNRELNLSMEGITEITEEEYYKID